MTNKMINKTTKINGANSFHINYKKDGIVDCYLDLTDGHDYDIEYSIEEEKITYISLIRKDLVTETMKTEMIEEIKKALEEK